jgi:glucose/arabinose dehydrogenase
VRRIVAGAAVVVALAACTEGDDSGGRESPTVDASQAQDPTNDRPETTANTSIVAQPTDRAERTNQVFGDPRVTFERVGTFDQPVGLAVRGGDDALYVIEQTGRVVRWDPVVAVSGAVADLTDLTAADGERGLLGLAFSLDGQLAWVNYTDHDGDTVIAEYPVAADGTFGVATTRVVLIVDQPYSNHNGGDLALGPDGMLYIALGDGGSAGDPERRASDPTQLLGKLLRIDPTASSSAGYSIPDDNPFAGGELDGMEGAPEVWAWGLRNPWRIAFDPVTADLWIADVGQERFEEVNVVRPTDERPAGWGLDFGWSAFEGNARFNDDLADTGRDVKPVVVYEHGLDGCSVSGGAVYRGSAILGLAPAFVYGDYCSGRIWAFDAESGRNVLLRDGLGLITSVRSGPDGELYVTDQAGALLKMIPG